MSFQSSQTIAKRFFLLGMLVMCVAGCGPIRVDIGTVENPCGTYTHHWVTGEVEVLILQEDMSYQHHLFADAKAQSTGSTLHTSKGNWTIKIRGNGLFDLVTFTPFFSMYDHQQQVSPKIGAYSFREYSMYWNPFWDKEHPRLQHSEDGDGPYLSRDMK